MSLRRNTGVLDSPSFFLEKIKRISPARPLLLGIFAKKMRLLLTEPFVLSKISLAKDGSQIDSEFQLDPYSPKFFFPKSEGWIAFFFLKYHHELFWWNKESRRLEMSKPRSVVVMSQTPINIFVLFDLWKTSVQYECNYILIYSIDFRDFARYRYSCAYIMCYVCTEVFIQNALYMYVER